MEIPSAHFGRKAHRVVPDDAIVRVELRLPAPFVAKLSTESAKRGCSMSHVMTQWLSEAGRFRGDDSQGAGGAYRTNPKTNSGPDPARSCPAVTKIFVEIFVSISIQHVLPM